MKGGSHADGDFHTRGSTLPLDEGGPTWTKGPPAQLPTQDQDCCRHRGEKDGAVELLDRRSSKEGPLPKSIVTLFLVGATIGGLYFFKNYRIEGLDHLKVVPRSTVAATADAAVRPAAASGKTIRIASFNLQAFGPHKTENPGVMEVLAKTIRQFDVVAIQEVRSARQDVVGQLVQAVNAAGRRYNYVLGPRLGRTSVKEQYAYVFDEATIEIDRTKVYTINDPDDLLHRPPLIATFRARGPPPDQAFTFTLINVHIDPDVVADEMNQMDNVLFSVRDYAPAEDDVILLGDFNSDARHLGELGNVAGLVAAITDKFTNTRQTHQYDNLFFQLPATCEYTGQSGVYDFLRRYNLTLEQALLVSDHLPVWAEFSRTEGGSAPVVATAPAASATR